MKVWLTWSLAGGAVVWLVSLEALYLLTNPVCTGASRGLMHAVTLAGVLASLGLAGWAWTKRARADRPETPLPETAQDWLARASTVANLWFALVILSTEGVILLYRGCL